MKTEGFIYEDLLKQTKCRIVYSSKGELLTKVPAPSIPFGIHNCHMQNCSGDFLCTRHKFCIPIENVCDGINHCWNNEDELNCGQF